MEVSVAKNLLTKGLDLIKTRQVWADLGAGDGLFTQALASLLPTGSKIISLDSDERALKRIAIDRHDVTLQTLVADLNNLPPSLPMFDGIVMANSLHYIQNQSAFLLDLKKSLLKHDGVLILIEYDLEKPNPWVPYPISKQKLSDLAVQAGFHPPDFFNSVKSKLNSSEIYSAGLKPLA